MLGDSLSADPTFGQPVATELDVLPVHPHATRDNGRAPFEDGARGYLAELSHARRRCASWSEEEECPNEHGATSESVSTGTSRTDLLERGCPRTLAEEMAARAVNKERARQRRGADRRAGRWMDDISSGYRGGLRSHRGERGADAGAIYTKKRAKRALRAAQR